MTTRALGIIGKGLTGPWMRLVGLDNNILGMNRYYAEAQEKCHSWSQDASQLLRPSPPSVFADVAIKDDVALDSLMKPTSNNGKTITLLQDLCQASLIIIERQLKDQLPGGHYWDPSEALQHQSRSCSATYISGEKNFAIADQIMYHAKNAKPSHVESKVMFQVNKTSSWLVERDDAANHKCTDHARKVARKNTEADKERNSYEESSRRSPDSHAREFTNVRTLPVKRSSSGLSCHISTVVCGSPWVKLSIKPGNSR